MIGNHRVAGIALAFTICFALAACGEDESTDTTGAGGDGSGASGSGGSGGSATGGSGVGGGGQLGCATNPSLCSPNQQCCVGVPYPDEGICQAMCDMFSDRAIKHAIIPVDGDAVLDRLASIDVSRWRYDADPSVEHIGPMAQDFRAAFGVGESERHIATVDANGVTMAAVQALHRRVEALRKRSDARDEESARLRAEVASLHASLLTCPKRDPDATR
jgi:hypothetical protein